MNNNDNNTQINIYNGYFNEFNNRNATHLDATHDNIMEMII